MWPTIAFAAGVLLFHSSEYALASKYMREQFSWQCERGRGRFGMAV